MAANSNNHDLLSSWKEIAAYLNCDERTCRRWELEFGLPVHRMEGAAKSRVFAYKNEIDTWHKSRLNGNQAAAKTQAAEPSGVRPEGTSSGSAHPLKGGTKKRLLVWSLLLITIAGAAAALFIRLSPGQPADFSIQGSKLVILDKKGKRLWLFDTGIPNLEDEKVYRERFQVTQHSSQDKVLFPYLTIEDIDSDGQMEVIFCLKTKHEQQEGEIFCFSAKGKENWRHRVGRDVEFGKRKYSSDFRISGSILLDINDDGNLEILLFAPHQPHSPTQLLILDKDGRVMGDFFNFGQISGLVFCDLNLDGEKELLVAGMNDEYGKGFLSIFDASRVKGCSPQIIEYPGESLTPGTEKCYVLFPRTDVDQAIYPLKEGVNRVELLQNGRVQVDMLNSHIFFELDPELRLKDVKGSDYFRDQHRELKAAGKISSELNDAYYENLKKGVLYWDGTRWTSTPTMNGNWDNPR